MIKIERRKLLRSAIIAAPSLILPRLAFGQSNIIGSGVFGDVKKAGAATFAGPIDAVSTGLVAFYGLRAKSLAYASPANPCIDVVNTATGTGTTTINLTSSGYVDDAAVQAAISGGGWTGASVSKIYDQVSTNHLVQATLANMPAYSSTAGPNSKPGLTGAGTTQRLTSAGNVTVALPWTMFTAAKRSSGTGTQVGLIIPSSGAAISLRIGFNPAANSTQLVWSSASFVVDSTHSADATFHALIGTAELNTTDANLWVDNNNTFLSINSGAGTASPASIMGTSTGTAGLNGVFLEAGIYSVDFAVSGRAAALNSNMHTAYGGW